MTTPRKKKRAWSRDKFGTYHTGTSAGNGAGAVVWRAGQRRRAYWHAWQAMVTDEHKGLQGLPTVRAAKAAAEAWLDEQERKRLCLINASRH